MVFLGVCKETSHVVEITFDRNAREKAVTQTVTADPVEFAKQDPTLLTAIHNPFDESVQDHVRRRIRHLKQIRRGPVTVLISI